jgi:tRNA uridine 5-carbamoylmethylation protein Kti12
VILRGPLGSGKTTIARSAALEFGAEVVSIDEILELDEWDGGSEKLFLRANLIAAKRARGHLARGVPVIVDGNFYWKSAIEDLVGRVRAPHWVFTLELPLRTCIERDRGRPQPYGAEATRAVFRKSTRFRYGIPLDARRPIPAVVDEIRALIESRTSAPSLATGDSGHRSHRHIRRSSSARSASGNRPSRRRR